jgi:alpha-D-ribose 1-methylphosphonate 5-triphosphate synthase subunit PhnG
VTRYVNAFRAANGHLYVVAHDGDSLSKVIDAWERLRVTGVLRGPLTGVADVVVKFGTSGQGFKMLDGWVNWGSE